ncbi:MAG: hypothetical protein OXR66_00780 [Candidatus Woesearchaeota archaeon]|nr:hypothetical protein [Candidatus Woesearchaeota archaeon]
MKTHVLAIPQVLSLDTEIKSWGNSYGIRISKKLATKLGITKGDKVAFDLKKLEDIDGFGICKKSEPYERDKEDDFHDW